MFKHLLVPTDGSQLSRDTVRRAAQFARECGARVTVFYARADYPVQFMGEGALIDPISPEIHRRKSEEESERILAVARAEFQEAGVECRTTSRVSDVPYEAIIQSAEENGCDLIFMASHGRRGISGLLLGSETNKVLTHSKIPVLVYR
ncbi:MAG: universal stress protein [Zoogloeaceae bacterium]|jgi:nucleotide-binding universal stress UspA family protein|nr:universal stress protein [Zoogloeaceae bacterium]